MKTKFSNASDCIHMYAQQNQDNGRSSNIFFDKTRIYSYGYHYLLAEFIKNDSNEQAILINNRGYSNTTSKHISKVTQATRQYKQFFVTRVDARQVNNQLNDLHSKFIKAKKPQMYVIEAMNLFQSYNEYKNFTGKTDENFDSQINETILYFSASKESIEQARKEKKAIEIAKQNEKIDSFLNFKSDFIRLDFDILRMNDNVIETSQSVKIDLQNAKMFYQLLKSGNDLTGRHLMHYSVNHYANNVIKIGCHNFKVSYLLDFGQKYLDS
jgi:hypothetical protein